MSFFDRRQFLTRTGIATLAAGFPRNALAWPYASAGGGSFPRDFFWGASTSAAQSEGSPLADGGGESIWDVFLRTPKATVDGSNNLLADDEYHRWPEDLKLMQQIGLNAYRFSVSWPRVLPEGKGRVNSKGLDHYDRLIDALLEAKITPFLTTYHFDYPEALQKQGGWLNPDSSQWLADYAQLLAKHLSDRVIHWLTINEPNIFWGFGSEAGIMPPQQKLENADLVLGAHNILLGHGKSVQAIRAAAKRPTQISLAFAGLFSLPASESAADVAAARTASFRVKKSKITPDLPPMTMVSTGWWLDPIYLGKYPEDGLKMFPEAAQLAKPEDMKTINQPLDFCAVNLYSAPTVKAGMEGQTEDVPDPPDIPRSHYGWAITPDVLYWGPKFLFERYKRPIAITENGLANDDKPANDGKVHDPQRVAFLDSYLKSLRRAFQQGVAVKGYFHWSLLDNFEWTQGFSQRFGLIYIDYTTQKRILKASATRYTQIIRSQGAIL
jgi:beta-glucosidase